MLWDVTLQNWSLNASRQIYGILLNSDTLRLIINVLKNVINIETSVASIQKIKESKLIILISRNSFLSFIPDQKIPAA